MFHNKKLLIFNGLILFVFVAVVFVGRTYWAAPTQNEQADTDEVEEVNEVAITFEEHPMLLSYNYGKKNGEDLELFIEDLEITEIEEEEELEDIVEPEPEVIEVEQPVAMQEEVQEEVQQTLNTTNVTNNTSTRDGNNQVITRTDSSPNSSKKSNEKNNTNKDIRKKENGKPNPPKQQTPKPTPKPNPPPVDNETTNPGGESQNPNDEQEVDPGDFEDDEDDLLN